MPSISSGGGPICELNLDQDPFGSSKDPFGSAAGVISCLCHLCLVLFFLAQVDYIIGNIWQNRTWPVAPASDGARPWDGPGPLGMKPLGPSSRTGEVLGSKESKLQAPSPHLKDWCGFFNRQGIL